MKRTKELYPVLSLHLFYIYMDLGTTFFKELFHRLKPTNQVPGYMVFLDQAGASLILDSSWIQCINESAKTSCWWESLCPTRQPRAHVGERVSGPPDSQELMLLKESLATSSHSTPESIRIHFLATTRSPWPPSTLGKKEWPWSRGQSY